MDTEDIEHEVLKLVSLNKFWEAEKLLLDHRGQKINGSSGNYLKLLLKVRKYANPKQDNYDLLVELSYAYFDEEKFHQASLIFEKLTLQTPKIQFFKKLLGSYVHLGEVSKARLTFTRLMNHRKKSKNISDIDSDISMFMDNFKDEAFLENTVSWRGIVQGKLSIENTNNPELKLLNPLYEKKNNYWKKNQKFLLKLLEWKTYSEFTELEGADGRSKAIKLIYDYCLQFGLDERIFGLLLKYCIRQESKDLGALICDQYDRYGNISERIKQFFFDLDSRKESVLESKEALDLGEDLFEQKTLVLNLETLNQRTLDEIKLMFKAGEFHQANEHYIKLLKECKNDKILTEAREYIGQIQHDLKSIDRAYNESYGTYVDQLDKSMSKNILKQMEFFSTESLKKNMRDLFSLAFFLDDIWLAECLLTLYYNRIGHHALDEEELVTLVYFECEICLRKKLYSHITKLVEGVLNNSELRENEIVNFLYINAQALEGQSKLQEALFYYKKVQEINKYYRMVDCRVKFIEGCI